MDPFSILMWTAVMAGVAAGIYTTVYFIDLTVSILYQWFQNFAYLIVNNDRRSLRNREYLRATIKNALDSGEYAQIIFNNQTEDIHDARYIKTQRVDPEIREAHRYREVAFWS